MNTITKLMLVALALVCCARPVQAGKIDGPNVYAFCGEDPVNRVDPMGTDWEWVWINKAEGKGYWHWNSLGDSVSPRSPMPVDIEPKPSRFGQHYVPEEVYEKLPFVTEEAKQYLRFGKGSYTGWPDKTAVYHGFNGAHAEYNRAVIKELNTFIDENIPKGGKFGVTEAQEFLNFIKTREAGTIIGDFNRNVRQEMAMLAAPFEEKAVRIAELEVGKKIAQIEALESRVVVLAERKAEVHLFEEGVLGVSKRIPIVKSVVIAGILIFSAKNGSAAEVADAATDVVPVVGEGKLVFYSAFFTLSKLFNLEEYRQAEIKNRVKKAEAEYIDPGRALRIFDEMDNPFWGL